MGRKKRNTRRTPREGYDSRNSKRSPREEGCDDRYSARNDLSWYTRYPNLLTAAGSFPYPYRPGMQLPLGTTSAAVTTTGSTNVRKLDIPGVMVLDWMPSIGYSQTATDPASIMAKEIYAKVRQAYSGSLDADGPDFVIYLMALDSIFSYIAWLKRLYRVMTAWTPENYVLPDRVIGSMGFAVDQIMELRTDRTKLWQCINELVLQSRKFTCPATIDIMNRHYWMSDNVYTDEAMINSQFYLFNLKAVYQYGEVNMPDGNPGPGLVMTPMPTASGISQADGVVNTLYTFGRSLIDALVAWDDAYTINGYLRRAYEGDSMFIVDELPVNQPFNPVYEPEVLAQIENSRTVPMGTYITDFSGFNVSQDVPSNAVLSNPTYTVNLSDDITNTIGGQGYTLPPVLSVRSVTPTVGDSVIASRLQVGVTSTMTDTTATFTVSAGTEIPIAWRIPRYVYQGYSGTVTFSAFVVYQTPSMFITSDATAQSLSDSLRMFLYYGDMEQFDWHPFVFATHYSGTNKAKTVDRIVVFGDTHNITSISLDDLRNLHKICIYSELNAFSI